MSDRRGTTFSVILPKPHRLRDPKAIAAVRAIGISDLSGLPTNGAPPHHVIPVSCAGPDHRYNLLSNTSEQHRLCQDGLIPQDVQFKAIAMREGVSVETVIQEVNRMRGRG